MAIRILIADDHALFREMLRQMLSSKGDMYRIVGETGDGHGALNLLTRCRPDLLLLNYRMPGVSRLSTFCREVSRRSPRTRMLLLTGFREEGIAVDAAVGGIRGYVLKGAPVADLLNAISIIHQGGIWVDSHLPRHLVQSFLNHSPRDEKLAVLTRQELKILALMARGASNSQIASGLHISGKTVKNHLTHIFAKLGVHGRQQAVNSFLGGKARGREKR